MGNALQILGMLAVTFGIAVIVYAFCHLAALGVLVAGVGATFYVIGRAVELIYEVSPEVPE